MGWTVLETRLLAPLLHPACEGTVREGLAPVRDKERQITRWTRCKGFCQCWGNGYLDPHRTTVPVFVGGHDNPVRSLEALEVLSPDAYRVGAA